MYNCALAHTENYYLVVEMWKKWQRSGEKNHFVNIPNLPATSERVQERREHERIHVMHSEKADLFSQFGGVRC